VHPFYLENENYLDEMASVFKNSFHQYTYSRVGFGKVDGNGKPIPKIAFVLCFILLWTYTFYAINVSLN